MRRIPKFISVLILVGGLCPGPLAFAASLGPISEETPPAACDAGSFVSGITCQGRYCDNIQIFCARFPGADLGRTEWRPWISEEKGTRNCSANHYVAGLACRGKYCDNLSLYCVELKNYRTFACAETRSISEEKGGSLSFLEGVDKAGQRRLAKGIRCSGKYCDNKKFTVCEAVER